MFITLARSIFLNGELFGSIVIWEKNRILLSCEELEPSLTSSNWRRGWTLVSNWAEVSVFISAWEEATMSEVPETTILFDTTPRF